jgi:hypothetical protein
MTTLPKNVLYYGTETALPEQVQLQAGPLSVLFEDGDLRYIRHGDREVVRRVYVAVRDRNWGTVLPRLSNLKIERTLTLSDYLRLPARARRYRFLLESHNPRGSKRQHLL